MTFFILTLLKFFRTLFNSWFLIAVMNLKMREFINLNSHVLAKYILANSTICCKFIRNIRVHLALWKYFMHCTDLSPFSFFSCLSAWTWHFKMTKSTQILKLLTSFTYIVRSGGHKIPHCTCRRWEICMIRHFYI